MVDVGLFVDASTSWGVGLVWGFGAAWDAWQLTGVDRLPAQHIGWLEAVAVELAVSTIIAQGFLSAHILVRSDNQGVIGAWRRGRCPNRFVNMAIRRSELLAHQYDISLTFSFIASADNLADPISRGILGPAASQLSSSFDLPMELQPFLRHV